MKLTFEQIQNYFGNRGIFVIPSCFKAYGNNDKYIYWIPNTKEMDELEARLGHDYPEDEGKVLWVSRRCMYGEIEDTQFEENVPFKIEWTKKPRKRK